MITNNRDNGRTVTYGYDSLNRWNSASSQATQGADCWGQSVPSTGYDRYGNLLTINVSKCSPPALSISVNGNNRITNSGFTYDASGDETADGLYSYTWDAERRMTSGAGVTYTYDGDGQRVKKSSGTLYWRGAGGTVLAGTDTSGNTTNEYIFFGARIARRDSSGNVYYYFGNHLGSAAITNATGTLCYDADFYPSGGELAFTNNCSQSYKFAGMEQDSETGDYHTLFRQYASNLGRWLVPDPSGMAAVSLANPQSLNMYAYVINNPTTATDATGLCGQYYCGPPCGAWWDCEAQFQYQFAGCSDPNEYGCGGSPSEINAGEQSYITNNCIGCVTVTYGNSWGTQSVTFADLGAYFNWVSDPDAGGSILAAYQAYREFVDDFQYLQGADPNAVYDVQGQRRGFTVNYQADGLWLDLAAVAAANAELDTSGHGGNPSWRISLGFDWQLHTLDVYSTYEDGQLNSSEWHEEVPTWNPIHWVDWVASQIIPNSGWSRFACSYIAGCAAK